VNLYLCNMIFGCNINEMLRQNIYGAGGKDSSNFGQILGAKNRIQITPVQLGMKVNKIGQIKMMATFCSTTV
jgi:hypothetical protein